MDGPIQSLRTVLRGLRRTPGFVITAVLTLALGIGLSVAVFTVAEALLLRKLPFRDQDRLVVLWAQGADRSFPHWPLSLERARELARETRTSERVTFASPEGAWPVPVRDGDRIYSLHQASCRAFFRRRRRPAGAGPRPAPRGRRRGRGAGRGAESRSLAEPVWRYRRRVGPAVCPPWQRRYLHHRWRHAAGIRLPEGSRILGCRGPHEDTHWHRLDYCRRGSGRLRPGTTLITARDELTGFFGRNGDSPWARSFQGVANPLPRLVLGDTGPAVIVFVLASLLLLVITCVNVANLLLVRGLARTREVAVRSALGAGRGRVIAHLLAESAVLATIGGALGFAVAAAVVQVFVASRRLVCPGSTRSR